MNKQIELIVGLIIIGIVLLSAFNFFRTQPKQQSPVSLKDRGRVTMQFAHRSLLVEVVNTPESVTQGLSGRSVLMTDGMLFDFPQKKQWVFWMKEMQFPIDMIWIDDDKVVEIMESVPIPGKLSERDLPRYTSKTPVNRVLEIPAGKAQEWGIGVGDRFTLESTPK